MISKHTPGPWREWSAEIEGTDGSKIGQLYARPEDHGTWGPGVADANTRLVCAAPDLLAALRSLVLVLSDDPNDYPDSASHRQVQDKIAHAKSTIAKAQGGAA